MFWNVVAKGKLVILRLKKSQAIDLEIRAQKAHIYIKWKGGHWQGSKLIQEKKNKINVTFMIKAS